MSLNKFKENLPVMMRNKGGWKLTWSRSGDEGYDALMYANEKLDLQIRIDEKEQNEIVVKVWKSSVEISKQVFDNVASAINFVKQYMSQNTVAESLVTISMKKKTFKEATERGINHEYELLKHASNEYIRVLNLLVNNNYIDQEVIEKIKVIRDYLTKQNLA